ncbi:MAG: RAMP superfamily CRISPR-associated protein [Alicyclobacillaceae bacterium]|nr:RAMP superfamily CRISPR-associated protein [Alicyclobacillaceae bacterium]
MSLTTLTPLVVGTGAYELREDDFVRGICREGGVPVVPGSTVKGVIRSYVELLSKSCVLQIEKGQPAPSCKTNFRAGSPDAAVCPSCQIFGVVGQKGALRSLVSVGTFRPHRTPVPEEVIRLPQFYRPRKIRREGEKVFRKVYRHGNPKYILNAVSTWKNRRPDRYAAVSDGVTFIGLIDFVNLEPEELGLLALGMGAVPSRKFQIKMGYGKPAFLGSVQMEILDIQPLSNLVWNGKEWTREHLWEWAEAYVRRDPWIGRRAEEVCRQQQFDEAFRQTPREHSYLGWDLVGGVYGWEP